MKDPRVVAQVLGGSLIIAAVTYIVSHQVLTQYSLTGGLWSIGLFLLSVIPVTGAIIYVFA